MRHYFETNYGKEVLEATVAPPVVLEATHPRTLEVCNLALPKHRVIRN